MILSIRCCGHSITDDTWTDEPLYPVELVDGLSCEDDPACKISYANCHICETSYDWQPCIY